MQFAMLGPLEVTDGPRRVDLGATRQKAVLAVLLVRLNQVVSFDRLIDELWGDAAPSAASTSLQAYVSRLRRALEPDRPARAPARILVTEPPGYALRLDPDQVDAYRFERLAGEGRAHLSAGDPHRARATLDEALSLWRGPALADFAFEPFATVAVARLDELRATAEEDRIEALLAAGDHAGAAAALPPLIAEHPLRERLRGQLMVALYRGGRQAEALRAYDDARRLLVDELGIDPGRELQHLHGQLLGHDQALDVVSVSATAIQPLPPPPTAAPTEAGPVSADRPAKPLVGRAAALDVLDSAWQGALAGKPRFVVIVGEPGIGKTTLAEALVARAEASGGATAWGRCHDDEGALPLWPWAQVVRALAPTDEIPEHRRPVLAALLPELGQPEARGGVDADTDAARFRLYDAVRDSLERACATKPRVVVLDDLHWADASSLRLLRFLTVEIKDARLVVVVTLRDTEGDTGDVLAATLGDLARTRGAERIALTGLTEQDVAELVRLTTGAPGEHAEALAPELFRRADGNPFFVTELVRLLDSERRLRPGEEVTDIPAAVGDVVRQRIRRLPEVSQRLLRVAAAIGREFDLDVLAAAAGLDDDALLDALEPAIVTRVVSQTGPGPAGYRFSHALTRDALYLDIPPTRRWRLHGAIGDAIEALHAADLGPSSGELVFHYVRAAGAGRAERALRYACMAAEQAGRRLSFDEAAAHWRQALDLLGQGSEPDPVERSRLLLELATALRHAGDLTASVAAQDDALAVAEGSGDLDALARAALSYGRVGLWQRRGYATVDPRVVGALERLLTAVPATDSPARTRLLAGLAVALYYSEEHRDRVGALAADALAMARRLGDLELVGHVFDQVHAMLDGAEQLRTMAELTAARDRRAIVPDPAGQARMARLRLALGDASTLEADADVALRAGEELCDPALRQFAGWLQTTVAFLGGRLEEVEPLAARARALHDQLGFWAGAELYGFNLILVRREQGRLGEIAHFDEMLRRSTYPTVVKARGLFALERGDLAAVRALLGAGDPIPRARDFIWLTEMALLAELAAAAGLPCAEEVYQLLAPSADQVVTMSAYACLGAVSHYLGLLAAVLGRPGDARAHLEDAVALNDRIGAVPWGVRSRYHLAAVVEPVDPQRSLRLLTEASVTAAAHGLAAMGRRVDDALATRRGGSSAELPPVGNGRGRVTRRPG